MRYLLFICTSILLTSTTVVGQSKPKLVVGIVVDQMCYDYLYRFKDKFCEGGFLKLMNEGANFRNTQYNYIPTFTGPGHASIYSGTTPENHGIVANEWYERETKKVVNCVADGNYQTVGSTSSYGYCSPRNLKSYTVTDQLKLTYPNSKVISLSIKDRSAILPGGHLSDGSYWYDPETGNFITSSFFKKDLPDWIKEFNDNGYPEKMLNGEWNTLLDLSAYGETGPDNSPYEVLLPGKTTPTFPYDLKQMKGNSKGYGLFIYTPFANTYLTDLAITAAKREQLGMDGQSDFLCISYSTPDIVGHAFGPYSVEIEDVYIRLDLEIKRLIKELENTVGKDEFVLFMTADHAVVPVPQQLMDLKMPGGYFYLNENMNSLKRIVSEKYGHDLIEEQENLNIYLDHQKIDSLKLELNEVSSFIANEIIGWEGVKRVFTSAQILDGNSDDSWLNMVRRGFHTRESGDVIFMLEPGYLPKSEDTESSHKGTSHGSAFNYDTHVPLLWYGSGIEHKEVFRSVQITDIGATLIHLLEIQRTGAMTGNPLLEILK
ncbi:MAG: alkaline phosphatase family protein [Bacteroidetes bacterium]|nr:MAG: alkaline phosphatase family protein [Bacteroidota bacterium]